MMYPTITMRELEAYLDRREDMVLIDLRSRDAFACCHLQGAINLPYEELECCMGQLPRNKLLVFYCTRGGQSMLACNHLSALGYQVMNIGNGLCLYRGKYMVRT